MRHCLHLSLILLICFGGAACERARVAEGGAAKQEAAGDHVLARLEKIVVPVIGIVICPPGEPPLPVGKADGEELWKIIHKES